MKLLYVILLLFGASRAFFYNTQRHTGNPFGGQIWKHFEDSMKRLEDSFKSEASGINDSSEEDDDEDKHHEITGEFDSTASGTEFGFSDMFLPSFLNFGGGQAPWWKGKNVCVEREEIDESADENNTAVADDSSMFNSYQLSTCKQTYTRYICTTKFSNHGIRKTFIVRYECCHGFSQRENQPGCVKVDLRDLIETTESAGAKEFARMLKTTTLVQERLEKGNSNFTIFAPADDTLADEQEVLQEANQVDYFSSRTIRATRRGKSVETNPNLDNIIMNHVVAGKHQLMDLDNNEILKSESGYPLRINIYPSFEHGPTYTVNCGRITTQNRLAVNGIVHVVDKVLKPTDRSIAELIKNDDNFSIFYSLLEKTDLADKLDGKGDFTLFAPTNSAFNKLDPHLLESYQRGEHCIDKIIRQHILGQVLCTSGVRSHLTMMPINGEKYKIYRNTNNTFRVQDANVLARDMLANNGVIHVVDNVIMPSAGKRITEFLDSKNQTSFKALLEDSGVLQEINHLNNITMFIPTESAFKEPEMVKYLESVRDDKEKLKEIVMFHTTQPEVEASDFYNNMVIKSKLPQRELRLNMYASGPVFQKSKATVDCARILSYDTHTCGGVIHQIDRVLVPPSGNILETIKSREDLAILNTAIEGTELEQLLAKDGPYTFLAPNDDAFSKLKPEDLQIIMENKTKANDIFKQHIITESMCCGGVTYDNWPWTHSVPVVKGLKLTTKRDSKGRIHFGSTRAVKCDLIASNGIIHTVNKILIPQKQQGSFLNMFNPFRNPAIKGTSRNPNVDVFLFGV